MLQCHSQVLIGVWHLSAACGRDATASIGLHPSDRGGGPKPGRCERSWLCSEP